MNSLQQYLVFLSLANIALSGPLESQWQEWKQKHEKLYEDVEQEFSRRKIWDQNNKYVKEHNRGDHSFKLGLNEFADMVRVALLFLTKIINIVYNIILLISKII